VDVGGCVTGKMVVNDEADSGDVETTSGDISSY